jgi:hypothetical protein
MRSPARVPRPVGDRGADRLAHLEHESLPGAADDVVRARDHESEQRGEQYERARHADETEHDAARRHLEAPEADAAHELLEAIHVAHRGDRGPHDEDAAGQRRENAAVEDERELHDGHESDAVDATHDALRSRGRVDSVDGLARRHGDRLPRLGLLAVVAAQNPGEGEHVH